MRPVYRVLLSVVLAQLVAQGLASQSSEEKPGPKIPIGLQDTLSWKTIQAATVSNDGRWFAYRLSPNEGDSQVYVKATDGDKEYRFPGGESPGGPLLFSEDSGWFAFSVSPSRKEAKKLKQQKKPQNDVGLLDLSSGKKMEFEKVADFAFSGDSAAWIALRRYPAEEQGKGDDKWNGADLILRELASEAEFNIGNVAEFSFDKSGQWLAMSLDARDRVGNGIQLRDMKTGIVASLDSDRDRYRALTWTEEGDGLAVLKGEEHEDYEEDLYTLVGFKDLALPSYYKVVYDPQTDPDFPEEMTISPHRDPLWTDDLTGILFGIHDVEKKEKNEKAAGHKENDSDAGQEGDDPDKKAAPVSAGKEAEDLPELVIWHWKDKRLQSRQQVQEVRDQNFSYLAAYRPKQKSFLRLADVDVREMEPAPRHLWAVGLDQRGYELSGNLDGRRYSDVYVANLETGERKLAVARCRWRFAVSPDGTHLLYFEDGHYYTYEFSTGRSYKITADVPVPFFDSEDDHNVVNPPIRPVGWVKDGVSVLLSDNWDVWSVPVHGGSGVNLTVDGRQRGIRFQRRFSLDPEEKGIDLDEGIYFSVLQEWTKKGGIARVDAGVVGAELLLWDDASYPALIKAQDADVYLYSRSTHQDYPDYYSADHRLAHGHRLTTANPQQKDFLWSEGTRLLDYVSEKGDRLQAALFLPAGYQPGEIYPTVVYIYEKLSARMNSYVVPSTGRFNKSVYTSNGYAVLMPDITYKVNDPGMSAVWCVLPALQAGIASGVVDGERVGLHGHSWGGYQTAFLITQSTAFKAAVAGAPLTNMISMYSSVYWNSGEPNQPIFESRQGRFKGNYLENLEAYIRNSPVYFAANVQASLLLLHNDKDGAVDWNQGIEYFNTLRQLGKDVVMLQYKGENHGLKEPTNRKDYTVRMREFFDHHLKGAAAPEWLAEGVSHLELEKHLKERETLVKPPEEKEPVTKKETREEPAEKPGNASS